MRWSKSGQDIKPRLMSLLFQTLSAPQPLEILKGKVPLCTPSKDCTPVTGCDCASLQNIGILQEIYFSLDAIIALKYEDPREQEYGGWGEAGNKHLFFIASEDSTVGSSFKMRQLSRACKQRLVSFAVLDYIYRVRRKHCYTAKKFSLKQDVFIR